MDQYSCTVDIIKRLSVHTKIYKKEDLKKKGILWILNFTAGCVYKISKCFVSTFGGGEIEFKLSDKKKKKKQKKRKGGNEWINEIGMEKRMDRKRERDMAPQVLLKSPSARQHHVSLARGYFILFDFFLFFCFVSV